MSILILQRNPLEPFPYHEWLDGYTGDIVMIAARDKIELFAEEVPTDNHGYTRLEILDRFDDDELIYKLGLRLAAEYGTTHVLAHHEADVDTGARLRETLGIGGAWTADVLPFRDKALMKQLVTLAGIEVAPHTVPRTAAEARDFADRHGFPVVFKNRDGCNSVGLRILRTQEELDECLAQSYGTEPREDVLIEAFVPGRMCHVDGLVVDGRTVLSWASQYQYDLASFGTDPGPRIDLTLDTDDPLSVRLLAMTDTILAALKADGTRLRDHAFHAEIFHTPDDRLVLCEIASRPAGAKIREVCHALFGFNLGEATTRAQLGLPLPALAETLAGGDRPQPRAMSGQMLMMKRPGLVKSLPVRPDEPWVERYWVYARLGQVIPPASGSADFLVAAIASAPTRAECERRLRDLGARAEAQTEIVEAP